MALQQLDSEKSLDTGGGEQGRRWHAPVVHNRRPPTSEGDSTQGHQHYCEGYKGQPGTPPPSSWVESHQSGDAGKDEHQSHHGNEKREDDRSERRVHRFLAV